MSLAKQVSEKIESVEERSNPNKMLAYEAGPYKVFTMRTSDGLEVVNTEDGRSVFLQGDDADRLESELENAENKRGEQGLVDILSEYDHVMTDPKRGYRRV